MKEQYFEDYTVGQTFLTGRHRIDKDQIVTFAKQFDPQFYHLDEEAAKNSPFKGLAASGWHTAAITMRLMVDGEFKPAGGILGVGFDELSWTRPVRPGDELYVKSEILEARPSKSKNDRGTIRVRNTTFNQNDEIVQTFTGNLLVPRRTPASYGSRIRLIRNIAPMRYVTRLASVNSGRSCLPFDCGRLRPSGRIMSASLVPSPLISHS